MKKPSIEDKQYSLLGTLYELEVNLLLISIDKATKLLVEQLLSKEVLMYSVVQLIRELPDGYAETCFNKGVIRRKREISVIRYKECHKLFRWDCTGLNGIIWDKYLRYGVFVEKI